MQTLWNDLVVLRESTLAAVKALPDDAPKEARQQLWKIFEEQIQAVERSEAVCAVLGWEARSWVMEHFRLAAREAVKRNGTLHLKKRLDSIVIPMRFTGGGLPVERLWNRRSNKFQLNRVDNLYYLDETNQNRRRRISGGSFTIGETRMPFRTILHRDLPSAAIIKAIAWCGQRHPTRGWRWSLNFTLEQPPPPPILSPRKRAAALDLGWRKFEGHIRIGVLHDTSGNTFELRLPLLNTGTTRTRRDKLPDSFADILKMESEVGLLVEAAKKSLRESLPDPVPEESQELISHLTKVQQGGLVKLLRIFEAAHEADDTGELPQSVIVLREWLEENNKLRKRITDTRDRLLRRRRHNYENLALWLFRTYDAVVWESKFDLKEKAENTAGNIVLRRAAKYRAWAGLSELRGLIRRAAQKTRGSLIEGQATEGAGKCAQCGVACEPTDKLMITCPNGHLIDQDIRKARNLLALLPDDLRSMETTEDLPAIPEHLRSQIVALD